MSSGYIPVKAEEWAKMVEATKVAADLMVENERLKAEVERLRKAGDELAMFDPCSGYYEEFFKMADAWLAAKEGRETK